jgi:hypothetical protein
MRHRLHLDDLRAAVGFLGGLPGALRRPVTRAEAQATRRGWLRNRESDFIALARDAVYGRWPSPYRRLLELAGCELGDLERLVRADGLEGALERLCRAGVFLTIDELKGRRPVQRGSVTFELDPRSVRNPRLVGHLSTVTGGSRGRATEVPVDLDAIRERAVTLRMWLTAVGDRAWRFGHWGLPGGGTLGNLIEYLLAETPVTAWFWRVDPGAADLHPRFHWSARGLRLSALLAGRPVPRPRYVPVTAASPVLDWFEGEVRAGGAPLMMMTPSAAVELCREAAGQGRDLRGAHFLLVSEPCTPARRAAIEAAGAVPLVRYASTEIRPIGYGCLAGDAGADEVHVVAEYVAVIQPGAHAAVSATAPPMPAQATLLTTLRATAPLVLLNVSLGDQASLTRRACGCPLESLGWSTHLSEIRSFEKLSTAGMTFLDTEIVPILELTLPRRFGGGPTDFQLVEAESSAGRPILKLLVHPRLGPLDEQAVVDTFLEALAAGSDARQVQALAWREAGLPRVERRLPMPTASGKVLHLHVETGQGNARPPTGGR